MNTVLLAGRAEAQLALWRDALMAQGSWQVAEPVQTLAALRQQLLRLQPVALVAELSLLDGPLADLVQVLRNGGRHHSLPVLVVAQHEQDPQLLSALQAGADSFCTQPQDLPRQLGEMLAGGAEIAPWIARRLLEHFGIGPLGTRERARVEELANPLALVPSEKQLLRQLSAGLRLNDVAAVEGVRAGELTSRVRGIYRKMQWAQRAGGLSLA